MHEMAIAENILGIALDYAARNGAKAIRRIGLRLGELAGVETESLGFCFAALAEGTIAAGAELCFERVPLVGRCNKCGQEIHLENCRFFCPECDTGVLQIISGRELQVDYLEVD